MVIVPSANRGHRRAEKRQICSSKNFYFAVPDYFPNKRAQRFASPCRTVLASIFLLGIVAPQAFAADPPVGDLSAQAMVQQSFQHDSNPLLSSSGRKAVNGSVTSPEIILNDDSPVSHADLDSRVDVNEFDVKGFSSTDVHSTGHLNRTGELWQAALAATIDYDTTRTSEANASGINIAGIRHTALSLQPQATVNITPVDQAQIVTSYLRSLYENKNFYTNYETFGVTPTYQHSFTALDSGQVLLQTSRYQTLSGSPVTIDSIGPAFGWNRRLSERLTTAANVGAQETHFHHGPGSQLSDSSSLDYNFALSLGFQGQQDNIQLAFTRQLSPNGNGSESQTTSLNLTAGHKVTERLETDLQTSYQTYDFTGGVTTGAQSAYLTAAPKLLYHVTEALSVDVTYQYRQRDVNNGRAAQSNALTLNVIFKPVARVLGL